MAATHKSRQSIAVFHHRSSSSKSVNAREIIALNLPVQVKVVSEYPIGSITNQPDQTTDRKAAKSWAV